MSEALRITENPQKVLDFPIPDDLFNNTFAVPKIEYLFREIAKQFTADEAKRQELVAALREVCRRAQQGEELLPASPAQVPMLPPRRGPDGKLILPELPPGLAWPTETYSGSPEAKRGGGGIVAFLERVWGPHIAAGVISRVVLREIDRTADHGIANFTRGGRDLPPQVSIPTKSALIDAQASAVARSGERPARIDWALRRRARRPKDL